MFIRLVLMAAMLAAAPGGEETLFNAEGYRIAHYRGPIFAAPEGVRRIAAREAVRLRPGRDAIFIDVLPAEGGHRDEEGRWHLATSHASIPGAHWFPEAGRGEPDPAIAAGFVQGIAHLSAGRPDRPLVVFCLADCWMSWNAALRLHRLGYRDVRWLADGLDGWRDLGQPLRRAVPVGGLVVPRARTGQPPVRFGEPNPRTKGPLRTRPKTPCSGP